MYIPKGYDAEPIEGCAIPVLHKGEGYMSIAEAWQSVFPSVYMLLGDMAIILKAPTHNNSMHQDYD